MGGCFFILGMICLLIGVVQLLAPAPAGRGGPALGLPLRGIARPAGLNPRFTPAPAAAPAPSGGQVMIKNIQKLEWIHLGQRIYARHPVKGELMAHVLGKITFAELWQQSRGPQVPWVPTGSAFAGFWLEGSMLLLNWQTRFYLLDEAVQLSDVDIQRDFAPYARQFAQSDQTADVYFAYPPAMWHVDDIGKFRIERVEGEGLTLNSGAIGRFIHASGDAGRALVIEDYEGGGGGQDTAWIGYQITEEDIKSA